jgi:hypothetical protein
VNDRIEYDVSILRTPPDRRVETDLTRIHCGETQHGSNEDNGLLLNVDDSQSNSTRAVESPQTYIGLAEREGMNLPPAWLRPKNLSHVVCQLQHRQIQV